jgi:hypothetical protein
MPAASPVPPDPVGSSGIVGTLTAIGGRGSTSFFLCTPQHAHITPTINRRSMVTGKRYGVGGGRPSARVGVDIPVTCASTTTKGTRRSALPHCPATWRPHRRFRLSGRVLATATLREVQSRAGTATWCLHAVRPSRGDDTIQSQDHGTNQSITSSSQHSVCRGSCSG